MPFTVLAFLVEGKGAAGASGVAFSLLSHGETGAPEVKKSERDRKGPAVTDCLYLAGAKLLTSWSGVQERVSGVGPFVMTDLNDTRDWLLGLATIRCVLPLFWLSTDQAA